MRRTARNLAKTFFFFTKKQKYTRLGSSTARDVKKGAVDYGVRTALKIRQTDYLTVQRTVAKTGVTSLRRIYTS